MVAKKASPLFFGVLALLRHYRLGVLSGAASFVLYAQSLLAFPWSVLCLFTALPFMLLVFKRDKENMLVGGLLASCAVFLTFSPGHLIVFSVCNFFPALLIKLTFGERLNLAPLKRGRAHTHRSRTPQREHSYELQLGYLFFFFAAVFTLCAYVMFTHMQGVAPVILPQLLEQGALSPAQAGLLLRLMPVVTGMLWSAFLFAQFTLGKFLAATRMGIKTKPLTLSRWRLFNSNYWLVACALALVVFAQASQTLALGVSLLCLSLLPFLLEGLAVISRLFQGSRFQRTIMALMAVPILLGWPALFIIGLGFFEPWLNVRHRLHTNVHKKRD